MKLIILFIATTVTMSCSSLSNKVKSMTSSTPQVELKKYEIKTLKNGLKVYFIPDKSLPRVSLTLLVKVGLKQETTPGQNFMAAELLESGTQKRNATQLADDLGALGTDLSIAPGPDFTVLSLDSLSTSAEQMLRLFAEIVQKPAFSNSEIERFRSQVLAQISRKKDNPSGFADDFYEEYLFENHAYARDVMGTVTSIKEMRKKDIIQHYLTWYRPNNSLLAVVGSYDEKFMTAVVEQMESWSPRKLASVPPKPAVVNSNKPGVKLVLKKGLAQTQIRLGDHGVTRNNSDYLTLRLATEILGGSFASRLMQKVRDDLGLTYSINASIDARLEPGAITITTFTKNETVKKTLSETQKVLEDYVQKGASPEELQAAKNQLIGQFPRAIETSDRYAFNLLALEVYGVPLSYLTDFNQNVERVTLADINRVLKLYFHPESWRILVYGDSSIEPQLSDLSPAVTRL